MMLMTPVPLQELRALDRPIWAALSSRQSHMSQLAGHARAFFPSISQFAAIDPDRTAEGRGLAAIAGDDGAVILMQADPVEAVRGMRLDESLPGVQMIPAGPLSRATTPHVERLGKEDVPAILSLIALSQPGPFKRRTLNMGAYFGVKSSGHLIALAGERLKLPGHTEISAVCVHPRYRGQGLARALTSHVAASIERRGEVPFLHTYATNKPAIALYESLGFELRADMHITRCVTDS